MTRDPLRASSRHVLPRAFAHPAFWLALALLLLNDHVFKGAGVLPAALTGKLSDFAGMVVAPPLAALALGAGRRAARFVAALGVGAAFALLKLSPACAALFERGLGLVGIPARVWVDPSDLWALALLPLGYALSSPAVPAPGGRGAGLPRWLQHTGVLLAAFACIATTGSDEKQGRGGGPEIENATGSKLELVLAATEGAGGCSVYRDDRISVLTPHAFVRPRELALDDGARASLTSSSAGERCGAAWIVLPDGTSAFVYWRDLPALPGFTRPDDERRKARRVVVRGEPGDFELEVGEELDSFELGEEPAPEPTCNEPEIARSLEFTALSEPQGVFELGELRTAQDGCLEVDWFAVDADTSPDTQRLCVPEWAFPFEVGAQVWVLQDIDPDGARTLRLSERRGGEVETQLVIWNGAAELEGSRVETIEPLDCIAALSACGAYVRPAELQLRGRSARAKPGDEVTFEGANGSETRVLVGPAHEVAWSAPNCEGVEARVGISANLLELRRF